MREKRSYVVVFSDGHEHFSEIQYHPESFNAKTICEEAVRARKITTSRTNPQKIAVQLFGIEISKGELKRRLVINCEVFPALERMTSEDFNIEMEDTLSDLPVEFQDYVRSTANQRGHSGGLEAVADLAKEIAGDLLPFVQRYQRRQIELL